MYYLPYVCVCVLYRGGGFLLHLNEGSFMVDERDYTLLLTENQLEVLDGDGRNACVT